MLPISTIGDLYGPSAGPTFDEQYLQNTPQTGGNGPTGGSAPTVQSKSVVPGLAGVNPLAAILVVVAVLFLVKFLREWKSEEPFHEAKAGLYFGVMATLWVAALLPALKAILVKYNMGPISSYVLNA